MTAQDWEYKSGGKQDLTWRPRRRILRVKEEEKWPLKKTKKTR